MGSKEQLALRPIPTDRGAGFDGKGASFRVYYSLRAGAVPFMWESAPGTPKRGAVAPISSAVVPESGAACHGGAAVLLPAISPPPSYQSMEPKGRRRRGCRSRSSWPAGGIVRQLLGMLGLGGRKSHGRSRQGPASYL